MKPKVKPLTAGELRRALSDLPDEARITFLGAFSRESFSAWEMWHTENGLKLSLVPTEEINEEEEE